MMRQVPPEQIRLNRRREHRRPVIGVTVRHVALSGRLLDLSSHGLAIESSHGLRIGDRYRLELVTRGASCTLDAFVRWCRLHAVRPALTGTDVLPRFVAGLEVRLPSPPALRLEGLFDRL